MRMRFFCVLFGLAWIVSVGPACAQQTPGRFEVKGALGFAAFPDESLLPHFVAGGAARIYLTRRLGVEPELVYMYRDATDHDLVFVPNITWDFTRREGKVQPYLIAGVGLLRHYESYPHFKFAANTKTYGAGIGVKWFLTDRMFVTPEVRLGWEPFLRITGGIGWTLDR